ncbi:hypothetical protein PAPYR_11008 [Paratrimastix pyriformis]|uniref:Uncharacterized protein n=1 Tax=Paratrimastix pyriformis TaxID=342808 RepID=A0ABQ8U4N9_9EUKA|nr:hypothetical protein PAPYR_11008 [Paratrimastix pyriformis]
MHIAEENHLSDFQAHFLKEHAQCGKREVFIEFFNRAEEDDLVFHDLDHISTFKNSMLDEFCKLFGHLGFSSGALPSSTLLKGIIESLQKGCSPAVSRDRIAVWIQKLLSSFMWQCYLKYRDDAPPSHSRHSSASSTDDSSDPPTSPERFPTRTHQRGGDRDVSIPDSRSRVRSRSPKHADAKGVRLALAQEGCAYGGDLHTCPGGGMEGDQGAVCAGSPRSDQAGCGQGFNTNGWFKHTCPEANRGHWTSDPACGFYRRTAAPPSDGWEFLQGVDFGGCDICCRADLCNNIEALKTHAATLPNCVLAIIGFGDPRESGNRSFPGPHRSLCASPAGRFNTNGWFKHACPEANRGHWTPPQLVRPARRCPTVGFNTNGWFKHACPEANRGHWTSDPACFYRRTDGWEFLQGDDYGGCDICCRADLCNNIEALKAHAATLPGCVVRQTQRVPPGRRGCKRSVAWTRVLNLKNVWSEEP